MAFSQVLPTQHDSPTYVAQMSYPGLGSGRGSPGWVGFLPCLCSNFGIAGAALAPFSSHVLKCRISLSCGAQDSLSVVWSAGSFCRRGQAWLWFHAAAPSPP